MQGVIYVRVSSGDQVAGTSLSSQEAQCRAYCREKGIEVRMVFREEGESAKTADRTELLRALSYCRTHKGRVQAFVVAKVDRLARNTEDHFSIRQLLQHIGISLHSVSEPIGNSPTEKFIETVLAAGSEFDNAIRKQRSTDGMISRMQQGIYPWKPPIGYICAKHRQRGEKKNRPDETHPTIFPLIQRGLRGYLSGEIRTFAELRRDLDAWGLAAIRGRATTKQLVNKILDKYLDFYCGRLVDPFSGRIHAGGHAPMISEEECHTIRLIRAGRFKPWTIRKDRNNPEFPLRRTVRCARCSRYFTAAFSRGSGGRYAYYFCANRSCPAKGKTVRRETLDQAVEEALSRATAAHAAWAVFTHSLEDAVRSKDALTAAAREVTTKRLAELERRRLKIFALQEDGTYSKEMFLERLKVVEADSAEVRLQIPTAQSTVSLPRLISYGRAFHDSLVSNWKAMLHDSRAKFEQFVFPEGLRYDHRCGIRTPKLGPLLAQLWHIKETNASWVTLRGHSLNEILTCLERLVGPDSTADDSVTPNDVPEV